MDAVVSDALIGRVLDGRYRVQARLARGGMAAVYTALDVRLDRVVALKVMHPAFADDEEFVARFIREAKSAARLSHPNVVAVYDQGDDAGHVFLAMEYVEGRTLRDLLDERGRLTPSEALSILQPVLAALAAAHEAGIVHRDVKPENVLLADDGRVKVADFGLARAIASKQTATGGALIGTVAYLAPEQVVRGVADSRSDVYAAGVMLFEMLTGAQPFDGETPIAVAYKHAHDDVPAPSSVVRGLPRDVDDLVLRATDRDPDVRPRDAAVFLTEAVRARRALPAVSADSSSPTEVVARRNETMVVALPDEAAGDKQRSGRTTRRRVRGLVWLLVVVLLGAAAATAGWWFAAGRYTKAPDFVGQAWSQVQAAHGDVQVTQGEGRYDEVAPEGTVVAQSPKADHRLLRGSTVTVYLSLGKQPITVTDYTGKPADEATTALNAAGLHVTTEQQYDESVGEGLVISQDPTSGTLHKGDDVHLVVSKGKQPIAVTDYTGKPAGDASAALKKAGFKVTTDEQYSDTVAKGLVISQDPKGGTLHKGDTVRLVVSKGQQLFAVPDEGGKNYKDAEADLRAQGFEPKVVKAPFGSGKVYSQSPGAGSMKPKGTTVTLYVV